MMHNTQAAPSPKPPHAPPPFEELTCRVRDGLKLSGRYYPAQNRKAGIRPALCLPGLTRNSRDFHDLAMHLSRHAATTRDVYTIDFRGRGHSDWDANWKNYVVPHEAMDVIDFCAMAGLHDAAFIGTSRGGLVTMVLAAIQPGTIGCAVLNDIGPVLETDGLMRIAAYVGKIPLPGSWNEAAAMVKKGNEKQFPGLSDEDWMRFARQIFNEKNGRPAAGYDPKLANAFTVLDGPMPPIWPQFEALISCPVLVLRGANSDLLSDATVGEMCRRHPACVSHLVPAQGHAPLLGDLETQDRIAAFLADTDRPASD